MAPSTAQQPTDAPNIAPLPLSTSTRQVTAPHGSGPSLQPLDHPRPSSCLATYNNTDRLVPDQHPTNIQLSNINVSDRRPLPGNSLQPLAHTRPSSCLATTSCKQLVIESIPTPLQLTFDHPQGDLRLPIAIAPLPINQDILPTATAVTYSPIVPGNIYPFDTRPWKTRKKTAIWRQSVSILIIAAYVCIYAVSSFPTMHYP